MGSVEGLTLSNLPALTSIQFLSGVTQARSMALIRTGVVTLDGLQNLESVETGFTLENNPALSSLRALVSLTGSGGIAVIDNRALPTCEVEWLLARSTWQYPVYVSGNDDGAVCTP
jgi:hypothetical protein